MTVQMTSVHIVKSYMSKVNLKKGPQALGAYSYDEILGKLKEQVDLLILEKSEPVESGRS